MQASADVEYQKALAKYDASFMSDAKWLRLFRAVVSAGLVIDRASWKFVDSEHSIWQSFPSDRDLMPTRFADGKFQPFEYKWIESVFIPARYRPIEDVGYEKTQDTQGIVAALESEGKFQITKSETGITIHAYQRRTFG
ncbi:hypothetical protein [Uliginosibacterium gangwonense]|uniref:hypothetical protein n=1 Tax=Uliginosibacterium gangwonense TaxID=392736 RepID=UPI00035CBF93|nr:hypothetical protein [Uliginosibacterium gangwonense]